jgi:hypothetical protein
MPSALAAIVCIGRVASVSLRRSVFRLAQVIISRALNLTRFPTGLPEVSHGRPVILWLDIGDAGDDKIFLRAVICKESHETIHKRPSCCREPSSEPDFPTPRLSVGQKQGGLIENTRRRKGSIRPV